MGTLVLKPIDIYRAYLAGYLSQDAEPNEPMAEVTVDQEAIAEAEAMAANALGAHDRERRADRPPRSMVEVVRAVEAATVEPVTARSKAGACDVN